MRGRYILNGKTPVPCDNLKEWGQWFETANRIVAQDKIGDVDVSTVFLAYDHNHNSEGEPILFETMIFGGAHDQYQERYKSWWEAEKGHAHAVNMVKLKLSEDL